MRLSVLMSLSFLGPAVQQPPPAPPILQEPQTLLLWHGRAPGAQGDEDRDKPAITVYMPPNTTGPMTAGDYRAGRQLSTALDEPRGARAGQPFQRDGHCGVRAALPARPASITIRSSSATRSARSAPCARGRASGISRRIASASWDSRRAATSRPRRRRISTRVTRTPPIRSTASAAGRISRSSRTR